MSSRCSPLAIWLFLALPAFALAQTPGDRELIRDRQERLLQEQQRRLDELQQLPGEAPKLQAAPVDDERCFDIEQIRLEGASLLGEADQQTILQAFAGQCLGVGQLNELLISRSDTFRDKWKLRTGKSEVEAALGRRVTRGKPGRPKSAPDI